MAAALLLISLIVIRRAALPFGPTVQALGSGRIWGRSIPLLSLGLLFDAGEHHWPSATLLLMLLIGWPVALITPLAGTSIAARITLRDLQGGQLELVRLTNIPVKRLISGYLMAALIPLRVLSGHRLGCSRL